jgi:hypothetical protein
VSNANSYTVEYKTTAATTWASITTSSTSQVIGGLAASTAYNVRVRANCSSGSSAYTNGSNFTTLAAVCAPGANEPNETLGAATPIVLGTDVLTALSTSTDVDWYRFSVSTVGRTSVTIDNLPANYDLAIFNGFSVQLASSANTGTTAETVSLTNITPGSYYIRVSNASGAGTSSCYRIRAFFTEACAEVNEPNNSSTQTTLLTIPSRVAAQISTSTDQDWYRFSVGTAGNYAIILNNLPADYTVDLRNSAGTVIASNSVSGTGAEQFSANLATGTYYIRVVGVGGAFSTTGCYVLELRSGTVPGAPVVRTAENGEPQGIQLIPNPASSNAVLVAQCEAGGDAVIQVINQQGLIMQTRTVFLRAGTNTVPIDVSGYAQGWYVVRLIQNSKTVTTRLEVQR